MEPREFSFEIPEIRLPANNDDVPRNAPSELSMILSPGTNDDSPRESLHEIPAIFSPSKSDDSPRDSPDKIPMILSPGKNDDSPRDMRRSLSADDWVELGQSDLKQIGVSFSKQLTAEISHCSQQLWELHDTLTAVIGECIGVMVEMMHREHDRNLRDFYSRFILLNRLSLLDLSGEVETRAISMTH